METHSRRFRFLTCAVAIVVWTSTQGAHGQPVDESPKWIDGFHLQRSRTGSDVSQSALFALQKNIRHDPGTDSTAWSADFALLYSFNDAGKPLFGNDNDFYLFGEGHVASDKAAAQDNWQFGASGVFFQKLADPKPDMDSNWHDRLTVTGIYGELAALYEADRDFDTEGALVNGQVTLNMPGLGIGHGIPWDPTAPVSLQWRPWIGIDAGKTLDKPKDSTIPDTIFRITQRTTARLRLNFISHALPELKKVDLFVENNLHCVPNVGGGRTYDVFITGLEFGLTEHASFRVEYDVGRDAPDFAKIEVLKAGFSVKF
jgi:hypothetical protein